MSHIEHVKLEGRRHNGRIYRYPAVIETVGSRLCFRESAFELLNEIKALKGSHWHGRDDEPYKEWSASNCERNRFQLEFLAGGDPYSWWDRPLVENDFERPLREYQKEMVNHLLTYNYGILAAEMGLGKTLAAIEIMERSKHDWWWVGPRSALTAVEEEFEKWNLHTQPLMFTYQGLTNHMKKWKSGDPAPQGVVFDESQRLKGPTSQRTQAAQHLADAIRAEHGRENGSVVLMTGTPSPKSPLDWWSQCEVAWPGFLREGSVKQFEWRLGLFEKKPKRDGHFFNRVTWLDDERRCGKCGGFKDEVPEEVVDGRHECSCTMWKPSVNEVAYLDDRKAGLAITYLKKDYLDLPEKIYREIELKPSRTIMRVAETLVDIAPTGMQAAAWLRELSDGFQYTQVQVGVKPCSCTLPEKGVATGAPDPECEICEGSGEIPVMERQSREIPTPKTSAFIDLLDENADVGRMLAFAGFIASIDRVREIALGQGWDVVQVDSRGWKVFSDDVVGEKPIHHWRRSPRKVLYLANPESGGVGLTLTEARMAVYWSNTFKPEDRTQSEDRGHRPGMDLNKGFTIVDLFHLGSDRHVLSVLKENRRLELMTLGEVKESL